MKNQYSFLFFFCALFLQAQSLKKSPWHIVADEIDPNHYYG